PGHADLCGGLKYEQHDLRDVLERASARETAIRTAVGAVCRQFLAAFDIGASSQIISIGGETKNTGARIARAEQEGDSVGGLFEVRFTGVPVGLGSHTHWDEKLSANLARTLMSMQAIKGVAFGLGFGLADLPGSKAHDPIVYNKSKKQFTRLTNNAGGFEGGMTTGEPIIIRAVMKPIATLIKPLGTINIKTKKSTLASVERADTCAVHSASVVAENILCVDLANAFLQKFGGDSLQETSRNYRGYLKQIKDY
ncbi:MAG TPA: chorismate synthase, partial [bacterium]|nr:chorismate synthase [bacterium]